MVTFDIEKLIDLEKILKELPKIKEIRELAKRISHEKKKIKKPKRIVKKKIKSDSKLKISKGLKKYHRYVRRIKDLYFPHMKYSDIQKELKNKKAGKGSSIPDVVWENLPP